MNNLINIINNYKKIRKEIPDNVSIVVAAKMRTLEEVEAVIDAGADIIGENYVQEAEIIFSALGEKAKKIKWHMIGDLQKNKINKALKIFDLIETIDSFNKAEAVNQRAERIKKIIPVFIEINIGSEVTKSGIKPEYDIVKDLAIKISKFKYINLKGIMTMGPRTGNPEKVRPYFKQTKKFFDDIKILNLPNTDIEYLSMGMSYSYKIAIQEGANIVRLGSVIFGKRECEI